MPDTTDGLPDAGSDLSARYEALLNAIPDMMFLLTQDGRFIDYVAADGSAPFVPPDDFIGRKISEILPPDVAADGIAAVERAAETGSPQTHSYQLTEDGVERTYESRVVPTANGEILAIVRDVTDIEDAAGEIARTNALVAAVTESSAAAAFIHDREALLYANPAASVITGRSRDEMLGHSFLQFVHPDDRARVGENMGARFAGRDVEARYELRLLARDSSTVWVDCSIGGVIDYQGKPAVVGTAIDITARKANEEALSQAREELERRTEARAAATSPYELTFRELTVLTLLAEGRPDSEIASILGIGQRTVNTHVTNILRKMNARTRTAAAVTAQREGLIG